MITTDDLQTIKQNHMGATDDYERVEEMFAEMVPYVTHYNFKTDEVKYFTTVTPAMAQLLVNAECLSIDGRLLDVKCSAGLKHAPISNL